MPERLFHHVEPHPVRVWCTRAAVGALILFHPQIYEQYRFYRDVHTVLADPLQVTAQKLRRMVLQGAPCGVTYNQAAVHELFVQLSDQHEVRIAVSRMLYDDERVYAKAPTALAGYEGAVSMSVSVRHGTGPHAITQTLSYPGDISRQHGYAAWTYYAGLDYPVDLTQLQSTFTSIQAQVALQCGVINAQEYAQLTSKKIALQ